MQSSGLRLLAIGTDPTLVQPADAVMGDAHQRQLRYARILDAYRMIVRTQGGSRRAIVHSPGFDTGWAKWSGTSFATPYVAAAIADQLASSGSVTAAADQVRKNATQQTYSTYPGLP